jgi:hypothetical protein
MKFTGNEIHLNFSETGHPRPLKQRAISPSIDLKYEPIEHN